MTIVVGLVLLLWGALWLWRVRLVFRDERRRGERGRAAAVGVALFRGVASVVLGIALIGKVYDLAIALTVLLVLWEVGLRRGPRPRIW